MPSLDVSIMVQLLKDILNLYLTFRMRRYSKLEFPSQQLLDSYAICFTLKNVLQGPETKTMMGPALFLLPLANIINIKSCLRQVDLLVGCHGRYNIYCVVIMKSYVTYFMSSDLV
ncbi:hypothetical protein CHUAL_008431 [Chamberlinius hualienensis]